MVATPPFALRPPARLYTPEEYLALEDKAEYRHEYRQGEITPMAGGSTQHNRICLNIAGSLNEALVDKAYEVFMADVKLWLPSEQLYTYPDVMVVTEAVNYHLDRSDIILNPQVIIEVLSKSTEDYDRSGKFAQYRTLESFSEYLLIDQTQIRIEHYVKQTPKRWVLESLDATDQQIVFETIPFAISIDTLYRKVQFQST
jgi:Uma2 family endonuclease